MTRYYLYERNVEGQLHGKETVIEVGDDGTRMILISLDDLRPNYFRDIVLKDSELHEIPVVYEAMLDLPGANPPNAARPYVFRVRRV